MDSRHSHVIGGVIAALVVEKAVRAAQKATLVELPPFFVRGLVVLVVFLLVFVGRVLAVAEGAVVVVRVPFIQAVLAAPGPVVVVRVSFVLLVLVVVGWVLGVADGAAVFVRVQFVEEVVVRCPPRF